MDVSTDRLELNSDSVRSFTIARVLRNHRKPLKCLTFHCTGELLACAGADDAISFINPLQGDLKKYVRVKKHGCGSICFTHDRDSASLLIASSSIETDDAMQSLDVVTCSYERSYEGHSARVVCIASSPTMPTQILSSSLDGTARLWDSRKQNAVGEINVGGRPLVAFDPKGLVFGVAYKEGDKMPVKLFDARSYEDGPFVEFEVESSTVDPTNFLFSPDGEFFLIASPEEGNTVKIFDAYEGKSHRQLSRPSNRSGATLSACFSPDAKYVLGGGEDNSVTIWDIASGEVVLDRPDKHALAVGAVGWNPCYGTYATACQNVALWLPKACTDDDSG